MALQKISQLLERRGGVLADSSLVGRRMGHFAVISFAIRKLAEGGTPPSPLLLESWGYSHTPLKIFEE